MASVTAVTASPTAIAPHGGVSTITPTITNPSSTVTVTVTDDQGGSGTGVITINPEALTYVLNATLTAGKAPVGQISAAITAVNGSAITPAATCSLGTLTVAASGTAFTFTAS